MILIADSGSTKTDWACVSKDGKTRIDFKSLGYNPKFVSAEFIESDLKKSIPEGFPVNEVNEIAFYGAGLTELYNDFMSGVLKKVFPKAEKIFTSMDLLASARALLGKESGFAAILGTGTNSCLYDGDKITMNIDSLGFILGDEGSAGYVGKSLIRDFIRGDQPEDIHQEVAQLLGKTRNELINQIYTKPSPNRYCAQFCKFVGDNRHRHPYFKNLMLNSFRDFFKNIVSHYPDYQSYKLNCVGSVGYCYRDLLEIAANESGMQLGKIIGAPLNDLVQYHIDN